MKTMCPPCYDHNGFVGTHVLGHMMYGYHVIMCINRTYIYIYIYIYIYLYTYACVFVYMRVCIG